MWRPVCWENRLFYPHRFQTWDYRLSRLCGRAEQQWTLNPPLTLQWEANQKKGDQRWQTATTRSSVVPGPAPTHWIDWFMIDFWTESKCFCSNNVNKPDTDLPGPDRTSNYIIHRPPWSQRNYEVISRWWNTRSKKQNKKKSSILWTCSFFTFIFFGQN